ncbi:Spectrin alpha chain, non-erythrocytic 1-like [Oopsacas minuta]|uniref:Spectrin alpha chain, non-erythrocytic 1-like n=1 Tax=Oopsacas minuta TaxID=111878 RepID=A0AAV7JAU7_9METZ|nr:Spectrin alpha chain, non-erythrocytic 1-like [Oopsacas minuta]
MVREPLAGSHNYGTDLTSVHSLQKKHQALELELQGHQEDFQNICNQGDVLKERAKFASRIIGQRISSLQQKWRRVKELSSTRKQLLIEAEQYQQFFADANESESWIREREPLVTSTEFGRDKGTASSLLENHDKLEEEIRDYRSEIDQLKSMGKKITDSSSALFSEMRQPVESTDADIQEEVVTKEEVEVEEQVMEEREVEEERVKQINTPQVATMYAYSGQGMSFGKGEKFELCKKHNEDWWLVKRLEDKKQGYVPANYVKEIEPIITEQKSIHKVKVQVPVTVKKKKIIEKPQSNTRRTTDAGSRMAGMVSKQKAIDASSVIARVQDITRQYEGLERSAVNRHKQLENYIKLFGFYRDCDNFEKWMKVKSAFINTEITEPFSNREYVEGLSSRFKRFESDTAVSGPRCTQIATQADKLMKENHPHATEIQSRQQSITASWQSLQELKESRGKLVNLALRILHYYDLCDETRLWVQEKDTALSTDDIGKDLAAVKALQRKHENVEREIFPIEDKLASIHTSRKQLQTEYPKESIEINARHSELASMQENLRKKASLRKKQLEDAFKMHSFYSDARELLEWVAETKEKLASEEMPNDVRTAEDMIQEHQELRSDITARQEKFKTLLSLGKEVEASGIGDTDSIRAQSSLLIQERDKIEIAWTYRNTQLNEAKELQKFNRSADYATNILNSQEASLNSEDVGQDLASVDSLIRQHEYFEKIYNVQEEKLKEIITQADKLIQAGHYDAVGISKRRQSLITQREDIQIILGDRKERLQSSKAWFEFNRMVEELVVWIDKKMVIASDENYQDPSNIERKIQKHQAFQAEIQANKAKMETIKKSGEILLSAKHAKSLQIEEMLKNLSQLWSDLEASTLDKTEKLEEALQQRDLFRSIDDELSWLKRVECQLASAEIGNDLPSVKILIKKHDQLESDLSVHSETLLRLNTKGKDMISKSYFNSPQIQNKLSEYSKSVDTLKDLMEERKRALQQSLKLQNFLRQAEDQESWIREQMQVVASSDIGDSWQSVDSLIKKHNKFEKALEAAELRITQVIKEGENMCKEGHRSSDHINKHCEDLKQVMVELKQLTALRRERLEQSLEEQKYLLEASEADAWLNEKAGMTANTDYGKDQDTTEKMLRKHQELEKDVEAYASVIQGLDKTSYGMISQGHFNSDTITTRQAALNEQLSGLQTLMTVRKERLVEAQKLHQFTRESDECVAWINDNMVTASSKDYGTDFKHAQTLKKNFDEFAQNLNANAERYNSVDNLARKLVFEGNSDTVSIKDTQDNLKVEWNLLQNAVANRLNKLETSQTILKFVYDVNNLLQQIKDKTTKTTQADLGKDLREVEQRQRKLENFEVAMKALEKQVQELSSRSLQLQTLYPGERGEKTRISMKELTNAWEELKAACLKRKQDLNNVFEFFKFADTVKRMLLYFQSARSIIQTEEPINTVAEANALIIKHAELKNAEIDSRMEEINTITKTGSKLVSQGSYASTEIRSQINLLQNEANNLKDIWRKKEDKLQASLQFQQFLKDAASVDKFSNGIEVYIANEDLPSTVDEADSLLKKHDSVHKKTVGQEGMVKAFKDFVEKLTNDNHTSKIEINQRYTAVLRRRDKNLTDLKDRLNKLEAAKEQRILFRDILDAISWISENQVVIAERDVTSMVNLNAKVKQQQAFEAELDAHDQLIGSLCTRGEVMMGENHFARNEIEKQLEELINLWEELQDLTQKRGYELEETCQLSKYFKLIDTWKEWIEEKQVFVHSQETGRDLEHCTELSRKFDIFYNELEVEVKQLDVVGVKAGELLKAKHSKGEVIQEKFDAIKSQWDLLCVDTKQRKLILEGALKVHTFIRDLDDIDIRITEKVLSISSELGKDLIEVEALQRKHERLELDLSAIEKGLDQLNSEAERLSDSNQASASHIEERFNSVISNWELFCEKVDERKLRLADSLQYQKFLSNARDLLSWYQKMYRMVMADDLAKDLQSAERQLETHVDRNTEIETREERYTTTIKFGDELCSAGHYASESIKIKLQELEIERTQLLESWSKRNEIFKQCLDLQRFIKWAEEIEKILSSRETFLHVDELGNSLDRVQVLIRQHDAFDKSVRAQEEKVQSLLRFGSKLVADEHYEHKVILQRVINIEGRYSDIKELAVERKQKLDDSLKLQKFLRDTNELQAWIEDKTQTASEENYRDHVNLQIKLQKHITFEAELSSHKVRYVEICQTGVELTQENHYASLDIETRIRNMEEKWQKLQERSEEKGRKLKESIEFQEFEHKAVDIEEWMDETAVALSSDDLGKDLQGISNLIKKQDHLMHSIDTHQDLIQGLIDQVNMFRIAKHFKITQIEDMVQALVKRYGELETPAAQRRLQLEDSRKFQLFSRDINDEMNWIREKGKKANLKDLGNTLSNVQSLLKVHQNLESDVTTHDSIVTSVLNNAQSMIMIGHYAEDNISQKSKLLEREWKELKANVVARSELLNDSLNSQRFYAEALESETWLGEKIPILASGDYGADQIAVDNYIKELRSTALDIEAHEATITKLSSDCARISESHFDKNNIKERMERVEALYTEVKLLVSKREHRLGEKSSYFKLLTDIEQFEDIVEEKAKCTASEEVGENLERCDKILKRFTDFALSLPTMHERVNTIKKYGESLLSDKHTDSEVINTRLAEMEEMWSELQGMIEIRRQTLSDARELHSYTQDANETIASMLDKDRVVSIEDYGNDVHTVQTMIRKHEGIERDLVVLEDKISTLSAEAARLQGKLSGKARKIKAKENEVDYTWSSLKKKAKVRGDRLRESEKFQKFSNEYMDLIAFLTNLSEEIRAEGMVTDVTSAESLLQRQSEHRAEVEARSANIDNFLEQGKQLIAEGNFARREINDEVNSIKDAHSRLLQELGKMKGDLEQQLDTQVYLREAEQLDAWLMNKAGSLVEEDIGDNVDEMLKKQEDLENMVLSSEEKIKSLMRETGAERERRVAKKEEEEQKRLEEEKIRNEKEQEEKRKRLEAEKEAQIERERSSLQERKRDIEKARENKKELQRLEEERMREREPKEMGAALISETVSPFLETELPPPRTEPLDIPSKPEQDPETGLERAKQLLQTVYGDGSLQRKNMLDVGGRKSSIRAWRSYYVVLKGPRLSFYKDKKDSTTEAPVIPPINVLHGICNIAVDYTKKRNVLRLVLPNGSEYLFMAPDPIEEDKWVQCINKSIEDHSQIDPSLLDTLQEDSTPNLPSSPPPPPVDFEQPESLPDSTVSDSSYPPSLDIQTPQPTGTASGHEKKWKPRTWFGKKGKD